MTNPTLSERFTACFDHNILTAADRLYVLKTEILQALDDKQKLESDLEARTILAGTFLDARIQQLEADNERYRATIVQLEAELTESEIELRVRETYCSVCPERDIRYRATIVQLQKERAEAVERVRVLEKRINDVDAEMKASERYRGERGSF